MYRGPLPVGYWDTYDVIGGLHMQLVMVDQIVLDVVSQKSHPGKLSMVWITSLDFMLDSLEKRVKTLNNWTRVPLNQGLGYFRM
jgi:hypothetical protein